MNHQFVHIPKCGGTAIKQALGIRQSGHETAAALARKRPKPYLWAFVRNPYARTISAFSAAHQHKTNWPKVPDEFGRYLEKLEAGERMIGQHQIPMCDFVCNASGTLLVNFLGKIESDHCWVQIQKQLKVEYRPLKPANESQHADWQKLFKANPKWARIVEKVYAKDFRIFRYERLG